MSGMFGKAYISETSLAIFPTWISWEANRFQLTRCHHSYLQDSYLLYILYTIAIYSILYTVYIRAMAVIHDITLHSRAHGRQV